MPGENSSRDSEVCLGVSIEVMVSCVIITLNVKGLELETVRRDPVTIVRCQHVIKIGFQPHTGT